MKNYILPLVLFFLIVSCEEENPQPVQQIDPFVGSWKMINNDLELGVSFDVSQNEGELQFHNINIAYPELTNAPTDYEVELYYRFPVNTGYKEITIYGDGITLTMIHNRIHLKTQDTLEVYIMKIDMPDRPSVELMDQIFIKAN